MSRLLRTSAPRAAVLAPSVAPSAFAIDPRRTREIPASGATISEPIPRDLALVNADGSPFGGAPTVSLRRQGGAFYSSSATALGDGWYRVTLQASDVVTPGWLLAVASAAGIPDAYAAWWVGPGNLPQAGNTWYSLPFFLAAADTQLGLTGLAPTVVICPPGAAAMAPPAGTVSEVGLGWYEILPAVADVPEPGVLPLYASATGAVSFAEEYVIDYASN